MPFQPQASIDISSILPIGTEATEPSASRYTVVVVDPMAFSPGYNFSLCDALGRSGHRVILAQGGMPRPQLTHAESFELWSKFHRANHSSAPRRAMRGLLNRIRQLRSAHPAGNPPREVVTPPPSARKIDPVPRSVRKLITFSDHFFGMKQFASEIEIERPDIIHFQWLPLPMIDKLYLSRLEKIAPLVFTLHNTTLFHGSPTSRLQGLGFSSVFQYFSAVIVHTEFSRKKLVELGWCPPAKIHVIPHGVLECHHGSANRNMTPEKPGEQTILFFGGVRSYKGVDLLIQAFAQLPAELRESTRLVIAGKPEMDASELRRLAKSLGVDDRIVWHLRFIRDEEVPELFGKASLVALPYREIDQSGVLMTAIAFEKPVVASRIGGIPEVIQDGVHGHLVDVGDVSGLAAALGKVLLDRNRREGMEKAMGLLRTGPLAWDSCAQRTIGLYNQILRSARDMQPANLNSEQREHDLPQIAER